MGTSAWTKGSLWWEHHLGAKLFFYARPNSAITNIKWFNYIRQRDRIIQSYLKHMVKKCIYGLACWSSCFSSVVACQILRLVFPLLPLRFLNFLISYYSNSSWGDKNCLKWLLVAAKPVLFFFRLIFGELPMLWGSYASCQKGPDLNPSPMSSQSNYCS